MLQRAAPYPGGMLRAPILLAARSPKVRAWSPTRRSAATSCVASWPATTPTQRSTPPVKLVESGLTVSLD